QVLLRFSEFCGYREAASAWATGLDSEPNSFEAGSARASKDSQLTREYNRTSCKCLCVFPPSPKYWCARREKEPGFPCPFPLDVWGRPSGADRADGGTSVRATNPNAEAHS